MIVLTKHHLQPKVSNYGSLEDSEYDSVDLYCSLGKGEGNEREGDADARGENRNPGAGSGTLPVSVSVQHADVASCQ